MLLGVLVHFFISGATPMLVELALPCLPNVKTLYIKEIIQIPLTLHTIMYYVDP